MREVTWNTVFAFQNGRPELGDGRSGERHVADEHEVEENAQRPDVHRIALVVVVVEQFRRSVGRASAKRVEVVVWSRALRGEAEVAQLYVLLGDHQHVFGFHVAVNVAEMML